MKQHKDKGSQGEFARAAARFRRNRVAMTALTFIVVVAVAGFLYPILAPYDPNEQLPVAPFSGPSGDHWFGTDGLGRDVFSRLLAGASVSLRFSVIVVVGALIVALPIGLFSGYVGRWPDTLLMRIMEGIHSFPALVLAIAIVGILGPSLVNAGIAVAVAAIPGFARLIRAQALAVREEIFIDASRAIGTPTRRILWRHLFPNVLSPLIVQIAVVLGFALLAEAGLSYLGLGVQPPQASWGSMLRQATDSQLTNPWGVLPPGIAIVLVVLAFNTIGEGLRTALGTSAPIRKHGRLGLTAVDREVTPDPKLAPTDNGQADLLVVDKLAVEVERADGSVRILDDVSFSIASGETLGLVGESGSGKSVTSLTIMRLLPSPPTKVTNGGIYFEGRDLLSLSFNEMSRVRGSDIAMVFQDPMASLNPAMTVAQQISQVVRWHEGVSRKVADQRMYETLELVGIPRRRAHSYPHEFSGGMRQRAVIAMALACRPKLLIADEPTTALDVTIQAQVLELLRDLRTELNMAMLFVTHDLGVVADICDRVAVMYAGQIVETADSRELFNHPRHPYTSGLLKAMPQRTEPRTPLYVIPGQVPQFSELEEGCRLASRCDYVQEICKSKDVELTEPRRDHLTRCVRTSEINLEQKTVVTKS